MQINEEIQCNNTVRANQFVGPIQRQYISTESASYQLPYSVWRVWNAVGTNLPNTAAIDDLGVSFGSAYGTDTPYICSEDLNGDGTAASYARTQFILPAEYLAGGTITLRAYCDTQAGAASIDFEAFLVSKTSTLVSGSDLVSTAATSVTTSFTNKDFVVTPTSRIAGDTLDIRMAVIGTTSVTANTIVRIPAVEIILQVKG